MVAIPCPVFFFCGTMNYDKGVGPPTRLRILSKVIHGWAVAIPSPVCFIPFTQVGHENGVGPATPLVSYTALDGRWWPPLSSLPLSPVAK